MAGSTVKADDKGKTEAASGKAKPTWDRWKRMAKYLGGAAVIGVSVFALSQMKDCPGSRTERPAVTAQADAGADSCYEEPAPVKGDGLCEVSKGEADHRSPTFDVVSCGYCGDHVIQIYQEGLERSQGAGSGEVLINGSTVPATVQFVTDRARDESGSCEVDFHFCGDGRLDRTPLALSAVRRTGEEGSYDYVLDEAVTYSESCRGGADNYCAADCGDRVGRGSGGGAGSGHGRGSGSAAVAPRMPPPAMGACPQTGSPAAVALRNSIMGALGQRAISIRRAITGNQPDTPVDVRVCTTLSVSASGRAAGGASSVRCSGEGCQSATMSGPDLTALVEGNNIGEQGAPCTWTICRTIPR